MAVFKQSSIDALWQDYMAVGMYNINTYFAARVGIDSNFPSWVEVAHPETINTDTRTAEQIKADLLANL